MLHTLLHSISSHISQAVMVFDLSSEFHVAVSSIKLSKSITMESRGHKNLRTAFERTQVLFYYLWGSHKTAHNGKF